MRRHRAVVLAGATALVVAVVVATQAGGSPAKAPTKAGAAKPGASSPAGPGRGAAQATGPAAVAAGQGPPAVEAGLLPWQLQAPISRESVLPGPAGQLVVAGGLTAGGSQAGVFYLNVHTGGLTAVGNLPVATHDAAATQLGAAGLIFGGGTAAPGASSQEVLAGGSARSAGTLPAARADAAAVSVGATAYVVGGYDGPSLDADVLATTDGSHFRVVAHLPVPVRYPAVAALGGRIYAFGGQAANGAPVTAVQVVDPRTGTARVVGQLPVPLSGAAAGTLGGNIYVAGGLAGGKPVGTVYAWDPALGRMLVAGALRVAVANAGAAVSGGRLWVIGGETTGAVPTAWAQVVTPGRAFGTAGKPGAGSPYYGDKLLVADRGNDRLLLLDDTGKILWTYPNKNAPPPPGGFYFPDDAFFIRHGTAIISNQEENETLVEIAYPSGRVTWQYGHPHQAGSAPGYLDNPDDAYLLRNGLVVVADPKNCRVLVINPATKTVLHQIGTSGACYHSPPNYLGSPNGDTPLADGNILVSEINGSWVDEYTLAGKLVWTAHLPIGYPSDPQPLGPDRYLVANYENPGSFVEFNQAGQVLYQYGPASGPGELNQPSLAEMLPSGVVMLNDDYNDRMVAIDPATGALVWQYGQTGVAGTTPGLLNTPDGFDILGPGGTTPTHPVTG